MLSRPPALRAGVDKSVHCFVEGNGRARELSNGLGTELVRQAVTAQQQTITGTRGHTHNVDVDGLLNTERAGELVAARVHRCLLRCETTHANPLLGHTVVLAELTKGTIAQLIGP
jgi:hypothetical protein